MTAAVLSSLVVMLMFGATGRPQPRSVIDGPTTTPTSGATVSRPGSERRVRRAAAAIAGLVAVFFVAGPLMVAVGVASILAWPRLRMIVDARSRRSAIDAALPDAIEMLILVVQAGMTPHQAIEILQTRAPTPTRPAFVEVHHRTTRGSTLADALDALPELLGHGAATVADTLSMAERYGTPIARALEQLSIDVRERRRRHAEADARKLPVRMSFPLVVCTLPSFVLVAIVPAVLAALASLDTTGF